MAASPIYDLFISYADADRAWVEGYLLDALKQAGVRCHSEAAFALGVPRLLEFERAIQGSQRTVLVLSPAYLADGFTQFVDLLAESYGLETATWPVIPLILHPVALPPRLTMLTRLDATDPANWPAVVERLCKEVHRPVPGPAPRPPCPYPGMVPFRAEDARFFYGREDEIAELRRRLRHQNYLFVIGPSGSGKSSLVFAGLIPELHRQQPGEWLVKTIRPGHTPLERLVQVFDGVVEPETGYAERVAALLAQAPGTQRLMIVIDQFEELFAQTPKPDRTAFVAVITALRQVPNCVLVLTMRADFYEDLMSSDLWPIDTSQRLEIASLRGTTLRDAIAKPAESLGIYLEAGLLERLLADAADEPGVLPLVQETMVLLWERMERRLLALSTYEHLGSDGRSGLAVAIATKADAALAALSSEQQGIARRIFLRLVQFGEGRPDTRRQQSMAALHSVGDDPLLFEQTLRYLTDNRLLTLSGEEGDPNRRADIAHEVLISGWPQLQQWLTQRREAEQTRRRLEARAEEWTRLGRSTGGLLDKVELREAEQWLKKTEVIALGYSKNLAALIHKSRTVQQQSVRVRLLAVSIIFLSVIVILASIAIGQTRVANERQNSLNLQSTVLAQNDKESRLTNSRRLAAQALYRLSKNQLDLALLLSIEGLQTNTIEAQNSLVTALESNSYLKTFLRQHKAAVNSVAFSLDGKTMVSGDDDGTIIVWDAISWKPLIVSSKVFSDKVSTVSYSSDNKTIIIVGCNRSSQGYCTDGVIRLWDTTTSRFIGPILINSTDYVPNIALSPDRSIFASIYDGNIQIWHIEDALINHSEAKITPITLGDRYLGVSSVAFSPDGKIIASGVCTQVLTYVGCAKSEILLWDVSTHQLRGSFVGMHDTVTSLAFSPDGKFLTSGSCGDHLVLPTPGPHACEIGEIQVWDIIKQKSLGSPFTSHTGYVTNLSFSTDGGLLVSVSGRDSTTRTGDNIIILWDFPKILSESEREDEFNISKLPTDQFVVSRFSNHTRSVNDVAFSPDGKILVSGSDDTTIIVWDVINGQPLGRSLTIQSNLHDEAVSNVAFSKGGKVLLSGYKTRGIITWDLASYQPVTLSLGHDLGLSLVVFSSDGGLAAASGNEGIILWNVNTHQPLGPPFGHDKKDIQSMTFSPNDKILAVSYSDSSILLWDITSRKPLREALLNQYGIVTSLVFNPNSQIIASSSCEKGDYMNPLCIRSEVRLWDVSIHQMLRSILVKQTSVDLTTMFSPDGKTLAIGGCEEIENNHCTEGEIGLWDMTKYQLIEQFSTGQIGSVTSLAFSPDKAVLAIGGGDGSIILWSIVAHQPISPPLINFRSAYQSQYVSSLTFSPDGKILAASNSSWSDSSLVVWDIDPNSWRTRACHIANRNLTKAEWNEFIGISIPYRPSCPNL